MPVCVILWIGIKTTRKKLGSCGTSLIRCVWFSYKNTNKHSHLTAKKLFRSLWFVLIMHVHYDSSDNSPENLSYPISFRVSSCILGSKFNNFKLRTLNIIANYTQKPIRSPMINQGRKWSSLLLWRTPVTTGLSVVTNTGVLATIRPSLRLLVQHSIVITAI